jgi:uncharacterized membrane protein
VKPAATAEQARLLSAPKYAALGLYACLWLWCVAEYALLGLPAGRISWIWPWCGIAASLLVLAVGGKRIIQPFALLALAGFGVELSGIYLGLFGRYSYTGMLGPAAIGVPLAMGLAWALLLCYVSQMLSPLPLNRYGLAAVGALWMTGIDLVVDPLAAGPLHLWVWHGGGQYFGVPLSNFLGWYIFSFLLLAALGRFSWTSRGIKLIGLSLVVSLALGAARHQLWLLVGIACGLAAVHWAVEHWHPAPKRLLATPSAPRSGRAG